MEEQPEWMTSPKKPILNYPECYCTDCMEHIRENDFFGRIAGDNRVICASCWTPLIREYTIIRHNHIPRADLEACLGWDYE